MKGTSTNVFRPLVLLSEPPIAFNWSTIINAIANLDTWDIIVNSGETFAKNLHVKTEGFAC